VCCCDRLNQLAHPPAWLAAVTQTFFGAGVTFGHVLRPAVLKHGRALVSGHDLTVGPGGCLMGGCHGALARQHGLGEGAFFI
jgi:hypothetical protein